MKKVLCIILVVLTVMTSVFAVTAPTAGVTNSGVKTTVSFKLEDSDVQSHRIGFSSDQPENIATTDPTPLTSFDLKYNDRVAKEAASAEVAGYVFYYINARVLPTLKIQAGTGLKVNGEGPVKIPYSISIDGKTARSGEQAVALKMKDLVKGTIQGYIPFSVQTIEGKITPDMANVTYKDDITLTLAAN